MAANRRRRRRPGTANKTSAGAKPPPGSGFYLMRQRYELVGSRDTPVLLFWGRQDRIVPFANAALTQEAVPQTQLVVVEECGHTPNYEKPAVVLPPLLEFLRNASAS